MFASKKLFVQGLLCSIIIAAGDTALSKDFGGFTMEVPQGWAEMEKPDPAVKAVLQSPAADQQVLVISLPRGVDNNQSEREFLAGMRDSLASQGLRLQQGGVKNVGGLEFQIFEVDMEENGKMEAYVGNNGHTIFSIQLQGNPIGEDCRSALESFRPNIAGKDSAEAQHPDKESTAYKTGSKIGKLTIFALLAVFAIRFVLRKIKARRQQ
jgi:hypothetical protein